jgi:hypothetical protein
MTWVIGDFYRPDLDLAWPAGFAAEVITSALKRSE